MIFKFILLVFVSSSLYATSPVIKVVTTTTDLQWLVQEIGGDHVDVESLLDGTEDPHYVDAMPHFVAKVIHADIFCLVGLDLEIAWVPRVLAKSGNRQVQSGGKGYCETGETVDALGVPRGKVDRSKGDIHAAGNPHFHLGPSRFVQAGKTVLKTLIAVDSKNKDNYEHNYRNLKKNTQKIIADIQKILLPIRDKKFLEYHKEFTYFFNEFALKDMGTIESLPGIPPSAGRLARVSIRAKEQNIALALAANTSPKKLTQKFEEMSSIPVVRVPISIEKHGEVKTYKDLLFGIANAMVARANKTTKM